MLVNVASAKFLGRCSSYIPMFNGPFMSRSRSCGAKEGEQGVSISTGPHLRAREVLVLWLGLEIQENPKGDFMLVHSLTEPANRMSYSLLLA